MKKLLLIVLLIFLFTNTSFAKLEYSNKMICQNTYYDSVLKNLKLQPTILILTYHMISDNEKLWCDYVIPKQKLEQDIQYLLNKDFTFVTMSMLRDIKLNPSLYKNKNIVAITFDDGYKSDYEIVYPLLKKYNVPATLFITGSYIDKERFMTMEQFVTVSKSHLVEIGNHSYEKHSLSKADLAKEFDDWDKYDSVLADFMKNSDYIYNTIGKRPISLSYPYGVYNDKADQYFKQNGTLVSVSTNTKNATQADIKLPLNRINRSNDDTIYKLVLDFWN